jgi:aspartyl/asparaginyl beta-hydroxylase (cupin superfamily)
MPILSDLLERHPEVITCNISTLKPGVLLRPHYGPFRGAWRYHLGISVPEGDLGIRLTTPSNESETYRWKEKEGVVFDDTLLHTAWNYTDTPRIVIFADVIKPLTGIKGAINKGIISLVRRTKHLSKVKNNIFAGHNISLN